MIHKNSLEGLEVVEGLHSSGAELKYKLIFFHNLVILWLVGWKRIPFFPLREIVPDIVLFRPKRKS